LRLIGTSDPRTGKPLRVEKPAREG